MHHPLHLAGRTPWSARVPLGPLFAQPNQPHGIPERPAGGLAADRGSAPLIGLPPARTMPQARRRAQPAATACPTLALEDKWTAS
jgi:hypothetical protein